MRWSVKCRESYHPGIFHPSPATKWCVIDILEPSRLVSWFSCCVWACMFERLRPLGIPSQGMLRSLHASCVRGTHSVHTVRGVWNRWYVGFPCSCQSQGNLCQGYRAVRLVLIGCQKHRAEWGAVDGGC